MNNQSKFFNNKEDIQSWLEKMNIKNYTINDSLIVDVNGNVDLRKKKLDFLPIQFGVVNGFFDISDNHLVSFKGSPHEIVAGFNCTNNKLSSLEYAPKKTTKFFCYNNPIKINHSLDLELDCFCHTCDKEEDRIELFKDLYILKQNDGTFFLEIWQYFFAKRMDELKEKEQIIAEAQKLNKLMSTNENENKKVKL